MLARLSIFRAGEDEDEDEDEDNECIPLGGRPRARSEGPARKSTCARRASRAWREGRGGEAFGPNTPDPRGGPRRGEGRVELGTEKRQGETEGEGLR